MTEKLNKSQRNKQKLQTIFVTSANRKKYQHHHFCHFPHSFTPIINGAHLILLQFGSLKMARNPTGALPTLMFLLLLPIVSSQVEQEVKQALVQFFEKLFEGNTETDPKFGWSVSSDPCIDKWDGIKCDSQLQFVRKIVLDGKNLTGVIDTSSLCKTQSLFVLSLGENNITGSISEEISNCKDLTHIYLHNNHLSGNLPNSLSQLTNLKRVVISGNNFSGHLPDLPRISGLITFLAENNNFNGGIPEFDFSKLQQFNVSNNNFSGLIPDVKGRFGISSFFSNPGLCGQPLPKACPKSSSTYQVFMSAGYVILGLFVVLFIAMKLVRRKNSKKEEREYTKNKGVALDLDISISKEKAGENNRSEYSMTSVESGVVSASSSLVVLSGLMVKELRFEDLLRAPAELIGKGNHGSLYKVIFENGMILAVKRMRNWGISREEFERRMLKIGQVKHPNVLSPFAYYCSNQEKLLVYEFQPNGSLFQFLHGSKNGQTLDWGARLGIATSISKALAFMHEELHEHGIVHGNLKSTNILFNNNMEPCISEYGLIMVDENQDQSFTDQSTSFVAGNMKIDVYGFGVILLELLTGKVVQNNGFDLATWVNAVVREEWTVEVFDRNLISEGASEERMVNMLQVALKCVNPDQNERMSMKEVVIMINDIMVEDERSIISSEI